MIPANRSPGPSPARERDDQAAHLMERAANLLDEGQGAAAAATLEEAAEFHREAGRAYDEARCLQLAATLYRVLGDLPQALLLAERAADVATDDPALSVSISTEQAESALGMRRSKEAVRHYTGALETASRGGLGAAGTSALLRRRAIAHVTQERHEEAVADFDAAFALIEQSLGRQVAWLVRVEQARQLIEHGDAAAATATVEAVEAEIDPKADPQTYAETQILRARLYRLGGRTTEALSCALTARTAALQAVAPVSYFAASLEIADAEQALQRFPAAYGTLAKAWGTLCDVIGPEQAHLWVDPCLATYELTWGEVGFVAAKEAYEADRRQQMQRPGRLR